MEVPRSFPAESLPLLRNGNLRQDFGGICDLCGIVVMVHEGKEIFMKRSEQAVENKSRMNCCQAVLAAFPDVTGLSNETAMRLGAAFGSGMGGMDGTCGALCGAEMVLGMKAYEGKPLHGKAKAMYRAFFERAGSTVCREIKGIDTGKVLCSCEDCVRHAAEIVEEI